MVFTDPPYGMNLDTDYSKMPGTTTHYKKVLNDETEFDMTPIFANVKAPIWYIWGGDYLYKSIPNFDKGVYIVWSKRMSDEENKVFGSAYELCWTYPKRKKEVWFVRGINQSAERLGEHPTQKPTELCKRAIHQNENVKSILDLFGGSGSTLIACEQLHRKCYTMELDTHYCDVSIARWEKLTGQKAIKL
jgi:DNA modification methylase